MSYFPSTSLCDIQTYNQNSYDLWFSRAILFLFYYGLHKRQRVHLISGKWCGGISPKIWYRVILCQQRDRSILICRHHVLGELSSKFMLMAWIELIIVNQKASTCSMNFAMGTYGLFSNSWFQLCKVVLRGWKSVSKQSHPSCISHICNAWTREIKKDVIIFSTYCLSSCLLVT